MKKSMRSLVFAASIALLATAAFAAPTAVPSIDVVSLGNGAAFTTDFIYGDAWLRVTGPQGYVQDAKLGPLDDLAVVLDEGAVDGLYRWEMLALSPISAELRAKLDAAAEARDRAIVDRLKAAGELQAATFYGTFTVSGGAVELPTKNYSADDRDLALKDQVFSENVIVDGSLCVGTDRVNNESFGFDTIRLKENNLRIKFQDTSSSNNFPSNDWQLVANESNNNGLNFFGIEDATAGNYPFRVEAGAGSNALYIDDAGNIGVGTSSPAVEVDIRDGNSPTLRLHQDGSSGFQTQIWDLVANETNFFLRDITNGQPLPFRVYGGTDNTNALVITANGDIGLGTTNAKAELHVLGGGSVHTPTNDAVMALFQNNSSASDGAIVSILAGNGSANAQMWFGDTDNDKAGRIIYRNGSDAMSFWTSGTERFFIESDGDICIGCNDTTGDAIRHSNGAHLTTGGAWTNASSRELKQDVAELSAADALAALDGLSPVTFRYKSELDETYAGFIAEEVPELVAMKDRKSLTSMDVVAVLTKVVQELRHSNELQEAELRAMRKRLRALESVD